MAKLHFRYGAMGCGKTMQLLQVAFNYEERGHKVCVIKPKTDTKNGAKLLTRIGPERETDLCFGREVNLYDVISQAFPHVACVLVDEAQFLTPKQADELMLKGAKLGSRKDNAIVDEKDHYAPMIQCPECESYAVEILNGKDIVVKNIVIEKPDD